MMQGDRVVLAEDMHQLGWFGLVGSWYLWLLGDLN